MGLIDVDDLYPDYDRELLAAAGNSGPGFPVRRPAEQAPVVLCTVCARSVEHADGRWVHKWPLPGADHPATPPEVAH